jgi:RNA polymerase-binding transcription factor DksA
VWHGYDDRMENERLRDALQNEEERLSAMRDDLRSGDDLDSPENQSSGGELSVVDQHPADVATDEQQREIDLSMIEQIESELSDVESALRKLDDGTYGTCEACNQPIDAQRLEALPATRFCIADASRAEQEARGNSTANQPGEGWDAGVVR